MIFELWKVTGPNWGSKFIFSRKEPTILLGFVIIRFEARAMKKKFWDLGKSGWPLTWGPLKAFKAAPQGAPQEKTGRDFACYLYGFSTTWFPDQSLRAMASVKSCDFTKNILGVCKLVFLRTVLAWVCVSCVCLSCCFCTYVRVSSCCSYAISSACHDGGACGCGVYVCMFLFLFCVCVSGCACVCVWKYVGIHVCMRVRMCMYSYIYIYIYYYFFVQ